MEMMIFKKNDCAYSLTYVGVSRAFANDKYLFQTFLQSFKAP